MYGASLEPVGGCQRRDENFAAHSSPGCSDRLCKAQLGRIAGPLCLTRHRRRPIAGWKQQLRAGSLQLGDKESFGVQRHTAKVEHTAKNINRDLHMLTLYTHYRKFMFNWVQSSCLVRGGGRNSAQHPMIDYSIWSYTWKKNWHMYNSTILVSLAAWSFIDLTSGPKANFETPVNLPCTSLGTKAPGGANLCTAVLLMHKMEIEYIRCFFTEPK